MFERKKAISNQVEQTNQPAILVIGPSWVGDMVMTQSLFKMLKREQAGVNIDVLAPIWSRNVLKRMPEIRHIISHSIQHGQFGWQQRKQIGLNLRAKNYQQAIVLPSSWKAALIPFWAKIPKRTGYIGELRYKLLNDKRKLDKSVLTRTIDRFVALAWDKNDVRIGQYKSGLDPYMPYPSLIKKSPQKVLKFLKLPSQQPILALCPGAEYGVAKQWPIEYYISCAQHKIIAGWQVWIFGSKKDFLVGAEIQAVLGKNCVNLCGKTTLLQAIDLLALSQAVISNDSGLMHIAAALNKPLIALFGSSSPNMTPPLSRNQQTHILASNLDCSPCYQRTCPKKHLKCLRELKPASVIEILENY